MLAHDLEAYLHEQIPASKLLSIGVSTCSSDEVELIAPLSVNLNHKSTAFGGSLSVIAILAGWSLVYMRIRSIRNEIVIQDSHMSYLSAVTSDFSARSRYEPNPQWDRFDKLLHRHGKGRVEIKTDVFCQEKLVAVHIGTYVAFKK